MGSHEVLVRSGVWRWLGGLVRLVWVGAWRLWVRPISIGPRKTTTGLIVVVALVEISLTVVKIEGRSGGRVVE